MQREDAGLQCGDDACGQPGCLPRPQGRQLGCELRMDLFEHPRRVLRVADQRDQP